ncbi:MAG: alpha/beta hydrolase [Acidimicrobiales bacterium]
MSDQTSPRSRHSLLRRFAGVATLLAVLLTTAAATPAGGEAAHPRHNRLRPVIFVHGGAGSGAQFETQAMRLTSNGYPASLIAVHEYDSTFGLNTMEQVWVGLDTLIADLLESSGADQVDLLGHSLGTTVSHGYLNSSPERAATVANYVNIDGRTATAPPGGVRTLAVWGEGDQTRQIVGAQNYYAPGQGHVQVATAPETFAQFYMFFTGRRPRTTDVTRDRDGRVRLAGEANLFPSNVGAEGANLEIWEVSGRTGERRGHRPRATFDIGPGGSWGPFRAHTRKHYEFALVWGPGETHHFYFQPFQHDDHLIRLLTSVPGTGLDVLIDESDRHMTFTVTRYKEWWADQGAHNDRLEIDGVSVLNAANSPRTKRVNAMFVFDVGSDGLTDLTAPHPVLFSLPFITGMDVFVPAVEPPDRTVRVAMTARASHGPTVVVNVPDWASSGHHVTVQFADS